MKLMNSLMKWARNFMIWEIISDIKWKKVWGGGGEYIDMRSNNMNETLMDDAWIDEPM